MDAADSTHPAGAHAAEHAHPREAEYVGIAVILAVITAIEVGLYYLDLSKGFLIVLLLACAVVKFAMVVLFFMHLKFDSRIFSWFFAGGLTVALVAFFVMLAMLRFFAL